MPYHADLRCSYLSAEMNLSWVYESMNDLGIDIEFVGEEQTHEQDMFEKCVDDWLTDYTVFKVFGHNNGKHKNIDCYETVWEFLQEKIEGYAVEYPKSIRLKKVDEEEDEQEAIEAEQKEIEKNLRAIKVAHDEKTCDCCELKYPYYQINHNGMGKYICDACDNECPCPDPKCGNICPGVNKIVDALANNSSASAQPTVKVKPIKKCSSA